MGNCSSEELSKITTFIQNDFPVPMIKEGKNNKKRKKSCSVLSEENENSELKGRRLKRRKLKRHADPRKARSDQTLNQSRYADILDSRDANNARTHGSQSSLSSDCSQNSSVGIMMLKTTYE
ncbi:hypothetical protein Adt_46332 [Abeliophyllum distichum]|uniref:Uncharacterized protein n=1 Tax=Abeliophyllum distichum TaxID=126358 RepID=A0ABD1P0X8_9LAMI